MKVWLNIREFYKTVGHFSDEYKNIQRPYIGLVKLSFGKKNLNKTLQHPRHRKKKLIPTRLCIHTNFVHKKVCRVWPNGYLFYLKWKFPRPWRTRETPPLTAIQPRKQNSSSNSNALFSSIIPLPPSFVFLFPPLHKKALKARLDTLCPRLCRASISRPPAATSILKLDVFRHEFSPRTSPPDTYLLRSLFFFSFARSFVFVPESALEWRWKIIFSPGPTAIFCTVKKVFFLIWESLKRFFNEDSEFFF